MTVAQAPPTIDLSQSLNWISSEYSHSTTSGLEMTLGLTNNSPADRYSSEPGSSLSTQFTTTVHETLVITHTVTGTGSTRTETTYITYSTSGSTANPVIQSNVGQRASPISTAPLSWSGLASALSQIHGAIATESAVYVIETLTVIPLATVPPLSSTTDFTSTVTAGSSPVSTVPANSARLAAGGILHLSAGALGTSKADDLAFIGSSRILVSSARGWNISSSTVGEMSRTSDSSELTTYVATTNLLCTLQQDWSVFQ